MKKYFIVFIACMGFASLNAQCIHNVVFSTDMGVGMAANTPEYTPFTWRVMGHYSATKHLSVGVGTGLSFYEKALMPVFADAKLMIGKAHKLNPYVEYAVGYSFVLDRNANGGFYMNPAIGMRYSLSKGKALTFSVGYEQQKLERLKEYQNSLYVAQFAEKLDHASISFKVGFSF